MHIVAVSLDANDLRVTEITAVKRQAEFPYIPTYLAYREFPGIEAAVRRLKQQPDVLLIDGHGRLHPALFGVACYVGVRLDLPTIGVAKRPLVGRVTKRGHPPSGGRVGRRHNTRSEEHTSELQSRLHLVCRLLLEK